MSDKTPERIGKYHVLRELGRGATSCVYLCDDAFHSREVAVKVVKSANSTDTDLGRRYKRVFMNEAALAGKLNHPHIVAIYDAASDDEMSYLVMEHVDGGTLDQYCSPDALLPLERLVEIVFKASIALDYAHRQGVIHCDIKPANILIQGSSDIKISDFGAAYFGDADHTFLTGVGSPAYMSPEQIQERQVTHQTDIYSLGVVMYQLLTGRLPFQGSSRGSLLYQIVNIEAAPPSTIRRGLPPALDQIVMRAMAKPLSQRYQHWNEFSRDLAQAFKYLTVPEESVSDTEKFTTLRALSFFEDFRDVDLWEMLRLGRWHRMDADSVILREGQEVDGFYVLTSGEIEVSRSGRVIDRGGPGHCFGDILYFEDARGLRSTTITTRTPGVAIEVRARELRGASDALQMQFNRAFIRILVDRLEHRESRIVADWRNDEAA
ncbi:MAG: protein kinase [Betaproteobacteria bacterium]|nr:protein kinase [Betaproteobacteria bacterium]